MGGFRHEQQQASVVIASTRAEADAEFIRMTLAVNGVTAYVASASVVFPSIDFVEGACVSVAAADAERARTVLNDLSLAKNELDVPTGGSGGPEPES